MNINFLLSDITRILPAQRKVLDKFGLKTIEDLLYHFPVKYGNTKEVKYIESLAPTIEATIFGTITGLKTSKAFIKKTPMAEAFVEDETGRIKIVWFNQPYIAKMVLDGAMVRVEGKISQKKDGTLYFSNPKIEMTRTIPVGVGKSLFGETSDEHTLYPVYPETKGVTSNWMYHS